MKIKITYTAAEIPIFEAIIGKLLPCLPNGRIHRTITPAGQRILYITAEKKKRDS